MRIPTAACVPVRSAPRLRRRLLASVFVFVLWGLLAALASVVTIDWVFVGDPGSAADTPSTNSGGRLPVNPSGGLIGLGHPVGATGVRMLLDAWKQVAGEADAYQIEGARNVATLNIGGSATTTVSFVVSRQE